MGTYTEAATYEATIYKKETTDPVLAGDATSPANKAEGQLANRTKYLKDRIDAAGVTLSSVFAGNMNTLTSSGKFYISAAATNKPGATGQGWCWVVNNGSTLATQWYVDLSTDEVYFRRITSGPTYNAWKKLAIDEGAALDVAFLQSVMKSMLNPDGEEGVIISGCVPFNINSGAGTMEISAGVALVGSNFVEPIAYSGDYPVYLQDDGTYTVVEPGSGDYITFDPYTSQNYPDVLRRSQALTDEMRMIVTDSDLTKFSSGLGKWEYKGWALCDGSNGTVDLRGRFLVGYHPGDADYDAVGETGGSKTHALTVNEMPSHRHTGASIAAGEYGLVKKSEVGGNVTSAATDTSGSGSEPDIIASPGPIPLEGGGAGHENRPPYKVVVYIQKV